MTTDGNTFRASLPRFAAAARTISRRPLLAAAWLAALVVAIILTPIWGTAFVAMGWLLSRRRMRDEGLGGLGETLAPALARHQFADGVWRGIWRAQKLGVAVTLIQLPTIIFAFLPAAIAAGLFTSVQAAFPGMTGMVLGYAIPGLVALACAVVVLAEHLVTYRILAASGPDYSAGLVFRAVGEAWKHTLARTSVLVGMTAGILVSAIGAGVIMGVTFWLADLLKLGMGSLVVITWTGALTGAFFLSLVLETLADWSDDIEIQPVEAEGFSFSAWLGEWLQTAARWIEERGVVSVGLVVCMLIGVLSSVVALGTARTFDSWVGLGWFAVTATILVVLQRQRQRRTAS